MGRVDAHTTMFLPGRVGLMVRLPGRPGGRPALLDAVHRFADELRDTPGTEAFVVSVDPTDEDVVWLHEWFVDETALEAHRTTDAFHALMTEMPELLGASPALMRIDPLRVDLSNELLTGDGLGSLGSTAP
jgi:quinol monooxygenase YgiN